MFRMSYLPGELILSDTKEEKARAAMLRPWLRDLDLTFGTAMKKGSLYYLPIYPTGHHPFLEEHIIYALEARDLLWCSLLCHHLINPADIYEILEVIALCSKPQSPLQVDSWLSARYLMGQGGM